MMAFNPLAVLLFPLLMAVPVLILYFTIKTAVKNALREMKDEGSRSKPL